MRKNKLNTAYQNYHLLRTVTGMELQELILIYIYKRQSKQISRPFRKLLRSISQNTPRNRYKKSFHRFAIFGLQYFVWKHMVDKCS